MLAPLPDAIRAPRLLMAPFFISGRSYVSIWSRSNDRVVLAAELQAKLKAESAVQLKTDVSHSAL